MTRPPVNDNAPATPKLRPCPVCRKPASETHKPFCSARCQDIDLHRWLSGSYAIPAATAEDEEE